MFISFEKLKLLGSIRRCLPPLERVRQSNQLQTQIRLSVLICFAHSFNIQFFRLRTITHIRAVNTISTDLSACEKADLRLLNPTQFLLCMPSLFKNRVRSEEKPTFPPAAKGALMPFDEFKKLNIFLAGPRLGLGPSTSPPPPLHAPQPN